MGMRLSDDLCTPKLFEKLELYALHACDGFGQMSQLYRAFGQGSSVSSTANTDGAAASAGQRHARPPAGAGFFDDDPAFLLWEGLDGDADRPGGSTGGDAAPSRPAVHSLTSVLCWAAADRLQRIVAHFLCDLERAQYWQ